MSLITAKGQEAKQSANKKGVDFKVVMIRLKENESVRVRLLGVTDYVEYMAHGDYNLKIYTQPCINSEINGLDPFCIAAESGVEGFDKLKAKKRYVFAFFDIDAKIVRYWDATKSQASKLIGDIEEYAENINDIAFNFKRTGTKTDTSFSLNPILNLDAKGKEGFALGNDVKVVEDDFLSVLVPRTVEQQIESLKQAGFPVEEFFEAVPQEDEPAPVDVTEEENPLDVM